MAATEPNNRNAPPDQEQTPASAQPAADATETPAEALEDVEITAADFLKRLAQAEAETQKYREEYMRALAETENVRRRAAKDRTDASQYAISGFARDLLSVADNLHRALASVDAAARAADPALDSLMGGVEATERELMAVFERYGLKRIEALGQLFDPHIHEALFEMPNPSVVAGTVVQVMQDGFMLHDRTLRPARVGVAKGGPKAAPAPVATANDADDKVAFGQREAGSAYEKPGDTKKTGSTIDETT